MTLSRRTFLTGSASTLAGLSLCFAWQEKPMKPDRPKRILLVAGPASHSYGGHEHPASCRFLARCLGRIEGVEAEAVVGWPEEASALEGIDALLVYSDGDANHPWNGHFDEVDALAGRGVGIGVLHYSLIVDGEKPPKQLLDWTGGVYELDWSVNPMWTARIEKLPVHPITRGVKPFELDDEWYYHLRFRPGMKGVVPLLTALPPASSLDRPDGPHSGNPAVRRSVLEDHEPQHLAWCTEREDGALEERGRGFGFTGLHWHWNLAHDGFRTLLLNAACWLAKVDVPAGGIASERPKLDELIELCGPPPPEWERKSVEERIIGWEQP